MGADDMDATVDTRRYDIHVVPLRDLRPHDEQTRACWCQPRIEKMGQRAMVIHHSLDGRELIEQHGVN